MSQPTSWLFYFLENEVIMKRRVVFAILVTIAISSTELGARLALVLASPNHPAVISPEFALLKEHLNTEGFWVQSDYHGSFYNVDDGARRTVGQPAIYDRTLWLFGNSATFDLYAPDALTSASQLQAQLSRSGYRWRVMNLSVNGQVSSGELLRLEHTAVNRGDLVLFVDGYMDLIPSPQCSTQLAVAWWLCNWAWSIEHVPAAVSRYTQVIETASLYVNQRHASFFHVVQPYIDPHYLDRLPGLHLQVPSCFFVDTAHMTEQGDQILGRQLFDALTLI